MNAAKEIIRTLFKEFSDVSEDVLDQYLNIFAPMVSKKKFGGKHGLALAYYVAHKMTVNGLGSASESLLGGAVSATEASALIAAGVTLVRDGETSISFADGSAGSGGARSRSDAEYETTVYGRQYLSIRDSCVAAIVIS